MNRSKRIIYEMPYVNLEKQRKAQHEHYLRNKEKYDNVRVEAIKRNKQFVSDYLSEYPCMDCGQVDIVVRNYYRIQK